MAYIRRQQRSVKKNNIKAKRMASAIISKIGS